MRPHQLSGIIVHSLLVIGLMSCSSAKGSSQPTVGVTLTVAPQSVHPGDTLTATVVFDEEVTGMAVDDLRVAGGTAGAFAAIDARTYTLSITSAGAGATTVDVELVPRAAATLTGGKSRAARKQAAIAYAPWANGNTGADAYGVWADLTVSANGETAVQRFRLIPPGTFLMGSPTDEVGRVTAPVYGFLLETQHQVTLTTPFWVADSECTQQMWKAVRNENHSTHTADGLQSPVENVTWGYVQIFLADLNVLQTGLSARLPTEAEWEYAARAGTTTPFSIDAASTATINCRPLPSDPYITSGPHRGTPIVVKSLPANPWGLHEMYGNVQEWCSDGEREDLGRRAVVDPQGQPQDYYSPRMVRGGNFNLAAQWCRSATRYALGSYGTGTIGFRMVIPNGPIGSG